MHDIALFVEDFAHRQVIGALQVVSPYAATSSWPVSCATTRAR